MYQLGTFIARFPGRVLVAWLLILVVSVPFALRIGEVLTSESGHAPDSEAGVVADLIASEFADGQGQRLILIRRPEAAHVESEPEFQAVLERLRADPEIDRVTEVADSTLIAGSEEIASAIALVQLRTSDEQRAERKVREIREVLPAPPSSYLLSGGAAGELELEEITQRDALRAEVIGVPLSLVVLLVALGSVVAAALPLLVALLSIVLALALLFALGHLMPIATFAQTVVSMLGLATGIDYGLLMINRFREELRGRGDAREAVAATTRSAGKAVVTSGATVMVALASLLIPPLPFIQSIGIGGILVILVSVLVSLLVLPAALVLLGPRIDFLRVSRREPGDRSRTFWHRGAHRVMRRPHLWTAIGVAVLLLASLPTLRMQLAVTGIRGLTERSESRQVLDVLEESNLDGLLRSFDLVVDFGDRGFFHPSSVRSVSRLTRSVAEMEGVERVLSPTRAGAVPRLMLFGYYATAESARESPLGDLVEQTVSENGRYALLQVYASPQIQPAHREQLDQDLAAKLEEAGLEGLVGGKHAAEIAWTDALYDRFPLAVVLVYLATFVLLGLMLRSLLIPLKAIALNTLTVGATFGVVTLIFQEGWGASLFGLSNGLGFVDTSLPIFVFAIVFGISMDYEVFLVSRIIEGHRTGMSDRDAVAYALGATGGVITSAALIMFVVFAAFATSQVVLIKSLAVGLSVAVALDATLVRLVVVPAVMRLAGRWNWWLPPPLARLVDRLDLRHD